MGGLAKSAAEIDVIYVLDPTFVASIVQIFKADRVPAYTRGLVLLIRL